MSCGTIPVVMADGWIWPFKSVIDWKNVAVNLPEAMANQTDQVLRSITPEKRCEMRRNVVDVYRKYISSGLGVIAGLVENMEHEATAALRS
mmetsp:Transcript_23787/g.40370  ORF Transcript_23787/g.40370 Transcript_23787/m.40370 type:complete len:91 (+) Transcript_23787:2-274(+)